VLNLILLWLIISLFLFAKCVMVWYNQFMVNIGNSWDKILKEDFESEGYLALRRFLVEEYKHHTIYPDMHNIFNALKTTAFEDVKVVIIGQDPYHGPNQAHGMCFSVLPGTDTPPSLVNIFKEIKSDLGIDNINPYLINWAEQGVLLLNAVLTVRAGQPNSHKGKGWETLTDSIIRHLNKSDTPIVYLLWGANARSKKALITNPNHLILESVHPSPLSAYNGFFGCKHFSKCNDYLTKHGLKPINWQT
jgi:uracil-DNA glycosylase